jgi:hypothetical protein
MVNVSSLTLNIPHLDIASNQQDCRRLGSKFLWLRCNDPIFYCGKEMAETRVMLGLVSRDQARDASRSSPSRNRLPHGLRCIREGDTPFFFAG